MSVPKPVKKSESNETFVFHSKKKANSQEKKTEINEVKKEKKTENTEEDNDKEVISLKQAKFDVFKFGIKGFSKEEQENAKIQLAVKLGAKPPKNKSMNYKDILKIKKEEKEKREQLIKENRHFEAKITSSNLALKKKKPRTLKNAKINKGDVGHIKGHIGSFNNGVLKIKKFDLKRLK